ncbi:MAG: hypothetical protein GY832_35340 [Chloroflexi bacterium]|nr:hypothetical protein [Chloroflexota bacterium]
MIESYHIDPGRGYDGQVGLYVQADVQITRQFYWVLRKAGFNCIPCARSNRPEFNHFAFIALPDSGLDKAGIAQRLRPLCETHTVQSSAESIAPDHETWRISLNTYIQTYRAQRFDRTYERPADAFDKVRTYNLIQNGRYDKAEQYLNTFATDAPPSLVPAYLIYLYHVQGRFNDVVVVYTRYADHLQAGDVNHRVIEWIVGTFLRLDPPRPEQALVVLDTFLPEFQRQGVSELLLALRAQARALQGQLPQTAPDLRAYLASASTLVDHLEDLLELIAGLPVPAVEVEALLDELTARIEPAHHWHIALERSALARRDNRPAEALVHLRAVLAALPSGLSSDDLDALRLDAANLYLILEQPQDVIETLTLVTPEDLSPEEQRVYWELLGHARLIIGQSESALDALIQAYQLGAHAPDVLQPLARLAYQDGNWELAQRAYADLLQSGFEPNLQDCLYAGVLAWLQDDPLQTVELLRDTISSLLHRLGPSGELPIAHEALVESLRAVDAPADDVVSAIGEWTDTLVALNDLNGLERLVGYIADAGLDRATTFALLEAIEPSLVDHPDGKDCLAQIYVRLLCAEVDASLRQGQALPAYTLDLQRDLFGLNRGQFDFTQEYLQGELARARAAELVEADFNLEPAEEEVLDLSERWVALVGGYAPVRWRVREILTRDYNLGRFTEVPPSWEARVDQSRVAEAVRGADLIVVVHRCIKHDGTDVLKVVVEGAELEERVRYTVGKGQSSAIQTVQGYFGPRCNQVAWVSTELN